MSRTTNIFNLHRDIVADYKQFVSSFININDEQISHWLENRVAIEEKEDILVRRPPMSFGDIVRLLSEDSCIEEPLCTKQLLSYLLWLSHVNYAKENRKYSYLPYRLHQFISQTGTVYLSLGFADDNLITLDPVRTKGEEQIPLYPAVFSRLSGCTFICVTKDEDKMVLKHWKRTVH